MNMTRIWEKIAGLPHQRQMSDRVSAAAADLSATARRITAQLEPYKNQADPFTALMADLYEKRQLDNLHRGPDK